MKFEVQNAQREDMLRIFTISSEAFAANEPFWDAMYPHHDTEEGRKVGAERLAKMLDRPEVNFKKVVNTETGQIAGFSKWQVYDNYQPNEPVHIPRNAPFWDTEKDVEYAEHLAKQFVAYRNAAIERTRGNLVLLDVLCIAPEYQRKGAGNALVKWGVGKADEMGVEATVESSVPGRFLYQKHGFVFRETVELEVPEKWKSKGGPSRFAWMERAKKE